MAVVGSHTMNQTEEDVLGGKAEPVSNGIRKRKRLQSVRVRNALRNSSRGNKNTPPSISSTSDDSIDNVHYDPKRRRASNLFNQNKFSETQSNNNNDGEVKGRLQISADHRYGADSFQTITFNKMPLNNRLNNGGGYLDCEDLSENSERLSHDKSESNSFNSKLNGDDEDSTTGGRTFQCPLCIAKSFRQINLLLRHLLRGHNLDLNDTDLNNLKYLILHKQKEISITVTPLQFSRPFTLARCKARRKSLEKRPGPVIFDCQLEEEEIEWNSKARIDGTFTCLKCDFNFENEQMFYEHIKEDHVWTEEERHRLKENGAEYEPILEFWCPECSQSFVTKSALLMHLKGNHEFLNDIELYLEKIGYDGEIPMAENQCNICYTVEDGPKEFEKHVKSHGLAFLRRQQLLSKLKTFN